MKAPIMSFIKMDITNSPYRGRFNYSLFEMHPKLKSSLPLICFGSVIHQGCIVSMSPLTKIISIPSIPSQLDTLDL